MKIQMIGTGAISPKQRSSCALVDDKILVDCGNGIVKTLLEQSVDVNKIEAILITHLHGDHFLDLPFLIMQRSFNIVENEVCIYCPKGTEQTVAKIIKLAYSDVEDYIIKRDEAKVKFIEFDELNNKEILKGYYASSYKMLHGDFDAYGYVIKNKDKAVGFSGDSAYCESIDKIIENSVLSVLDMSFVKSRYGHMGVEEIETLCEKYNKTIVATHMNEDSRKLAIEKNIPNLIIPNDGEIIEI